MSWRGDYRLRFAGLARAFRWATAARAHERCGAEELRDVDAERVSDLEQGAEAGRGAGELDAAKRVDINVGRFG